MIDIMYSAPLDTLRANHAYLEVSEEYRTTVLNDDEQNFLHRVVNITPDTVLPARLGLLISKLNELPGVRAELESSIDLQVMLTLSDPRNLNADSISSIFATVFDLEFRVITRPPFDDNGLFTFPLWFNVDGFQPFIASEILDVLNQHFQDRGSFSFD